MRFLKIFLFMTCIYHSDLVKGQSQKIVELSKSRSNFPFTESYVATAKIENLSLYKIPNQFKDYIIKSLSLNNKYGTTKFKLLGENERSYISFLININPDSSRTVVCDANNNLDFSDDKVITCSKNIHKLTSDEIFEIPMRHDGLLLNYLVQPEVYSSGLKYTQLDEQTHYLVIIPFETHSGYINLNTVDHHIYLKNGVARPYFYKNNLEVSFESSKGVFKSCTGEDVITIDGKKIIIDSISIDGSKLFLKQFDAAKEFKQHGFLEEFVLDRFKLSDINNHELSIPTRQPYTLLDFWGTWCAPCRELTPDLVALHIKHQLKVTFISLAKSSKLSDVKKYVSKAKMNWPQVVEDERNNKLFSKEMFSVDTYPTFILLDGSGKILFRQTGEKGLQKIATFLNNN
jgi:thiol-disulfide isomerase/thioredoxin